jgi:multiple sugar transport system substrate-binding protein
MTEQDIKSPLPPRRFSSLYEGETAEVKAPESEETALKVELPPKPAVEDIPPSEKAPPVMSSQPVSSGGGKSKLVVLGVIGLLVLAIIFLVFKIILPAIGGGKTSGVTLNYWGLWEDSSVIQGIIAEYESKNPGVKINYISNQKTNYKSRLQTRLEAGDEKEDSPDIFRLHATWLPMFKNDIAKVPAETAKNIGLDADYFDTYKNTIKQGGSWMGVPLMYDGLSLFYNKDLIDSGQVALPKSWWDLEMAANKLTVRDENGKIKVAGAALGLVDNVDHWSDIVGLMLKQGGVDVLADDEVNNKKMQDVLTFYTLFRSKDHVWDEILPSSTEMFANGKLAFYFAPSWRVFNIEEMKVPELRYEITAVPQLPTLSDVPLDQANSEANLTNVHWGTYWIEGVSSKSKKQKEAWKFLEYLSTKESLEKFYTTASQIRSFGEIYPRKSMADKMMENSKTKPFVTVANDAVSWYLCSRTFDEGLNDGMSKYFGDAINSMVINNSPPDKVMPDLRNGINQMVSKYGLK